MFGKCDVFFSNYRYIDYIDIDICRVYVEVIGAGFSPNTLL